jgi:glycogen(starch) synthase
MRILIVTEDVPYPNMGGLAKHALTLAGALVQAGHEVDMLGGDQHPIEVCGDEGRFGGRFFGELNGQHAGWKEKSLGMYMPPKRSVIAGRFARIIMRHARNYDVVHYHGHVPNVAKYLPPDLNFVQTRHDQGSDCFAHTRFRGGKVCESADPLDCASCITPKPNVLQRTVSKAAVVRFRRETVESFRLHKTVFVSDMLQRNLERTFGPGPWGTTIHHFVDTERIKRVRDTVEAPPTGGEFRIFLAAKLYAAKGVGVLLRELVPRLRADMRVTVAGEGPDESALRAEFSHPQVDFLGWCTPEATLRHAAAAHAMVVPSVWEEPFGSTTLEGLLLGKPTFALARGGTPEIAVYAAGPDQLRLHPDMPSLVSDLISFSPRGLYPPLQEGAGSAERAVHELLRIYRSPAGNFIN